VKLLNNLYEKALPFSLLLDWMQVMIVLLAHSLTGVFVALIVIAAHIAILAASPAIRWLEANRKFDSELPNIESPESRF